MMTHVAVYAKDIERTRRFYETYFDGISNEKYVNAKGFSSYFITFESGARLEIMAHEQLQIRDNLEITNGYSHLAFSVGSEENVVKLTEELIKDGYALLSGPRRTGDGYFESCFADPDGNRVEITV